LRFANNYDKQEGCGDPRFEGEDTMGRFGHFAALLAIAALFGATPVAGAETGGNAWAADACQQAGYLAMVGSDGTTFDNVGACVSYAAQGGTFATGLIIPAGQVATLSNASWALTPCDRLTYGYQLNLGALVPLASKPAGCVDAALPGATIGPFPTATLLRIFLTDTGTGSPESGGSCDYTFFSDGVHALVTGTNPYTVDIRDSFFCELDPTEPYVPYEPSAPGLGNISLTVTIA
jgi:hypothetical protein